MPARTILVIEDDAAIRRGVLDALSFAGYATLSTGDGLEGTRLALTANFDLLLLDLSAARKKKMRPKEGSATKIEVDLKNVEKANLVPEI